MSLPQPQPLQSTVPLVQSIQQPVQTVSQTAPVQQVTHTPTQAQVMVTQQALQPPPQIVSTQIVTNPTPQVQAPQQVPHSAPQLATTQSVTQPILHTQMDSQQNRHPFTMGEERNFAPSTFHGKSDEGAMDWLRVFSKYCEYKGFDDARKLGYIKVLLRDSAADWLESLPQTSMGTFTDLRDEFEKRFKSAEVLRFRNAKEIFNRKQGDTESVDDYVQHMTKLATEINMDQQMLLSRLITGFKANISNFVVQRQPTTIAQMLDAARLAEATTSDFESTTSDSLAELKSELRRISGRLTMANVDNPSPLQSREATPERQIDRNNRRVRFNDSRRTPGTRFDRRLDEVESRYGSASPEYSPRSNTAGAPPQQRFYDSPGYGQQRGDGRNFARGGYHGARGYAQQRFQSAGNANHTSAEL